MSWLEPVHVLLGLARGSLPAAVMQNFGRSMTLFGVLGLFTQGHDTIYTTMLYTAWAGSEVIRCDAAQRQRKIDRAEWSCNIVFSWCSVA